VGVFDGKIAIVTGATSVEIGDVNIGGAAAAELAAQGARVVLASRNLENAGRLATMLNDKHGAGAALVVTTDIRSESQIKRLVDTTVDTLGGLHVLLNVAGVFPQADTDVATISTDVWDDVMAVNLRGTMLTTKYALPHLRKVGGAIVNTASTHAFAGDITLTAYGAAKAGVVALTSYTATQYGREGVRCNAVCPGVTVTPIAQQLPTTIMDLYRRHIAAPELNGPWQMAKLYCFLASDDACAINGEQIRADNGMLAQQPFVPNMRAFVPGTPDEAI
jgi:NAD(P)-dependent dehydrogenase (short-subunit alcohol dehydrogenase family)